MHFSSQHNLVLDVYICGRKSGRKSLLNFSVSPKCLQKGSLAQLNSRLNEWMNGDEMNNRLKCSCSPRCNRTGILCWLSLKKPGFLCKLPRRGDFLLVLVQTRVGKGPWYQASCTTGMMRWEGIHRESNLELGCLPCIWQQLLCLLGWSSFRGCSRPSPSLHSPVLPLHLLCHTLLSVQGSVSHQVLLLQYFWYSLQLMLRELNYPKFNYLFRLKKKNTLDYKMQCF